MRTGIYGNAHVIGSALFFVREELLLLKITRYLKSFISQFHLARAIFRLFFCSVSAKLMLRVWTDIICAFGSQIQRIAAGPKRRILRKNVSGTNGWSEEREALRDRRMLVGFITPTFLFLLFPREIGYRQHALLQPKTAHLNYSIVNVFNDAYFRK